jgi:hypothetical protein
LGGATYIATKPSLQKLRGSPYKKVLAPRLEIRGKSQKSQLIAEKPIPLHNKEEIWIINIYFCLLFLLFQHLNF